ncbi:MFS transporter [Paralcaligenes ureilyticus]|uniref:Putative MFS transporter n=1 Tax=Paralcaligenes ureilyticus TaxID=627131 RepID=A0A4V2UWQ1_9BURK|nr:MFS transporter [Paralcaligenes ureilyticus]TCT00528.1 putative MFS transporter [Paralcaligenes ureilyticus]
MNSNTAATAAAVSSRQSAGDLSRLLTARMDRLPTTRYLWVLVLLISLGGFFEIYDLIFMGYIAPGMAKSGILATTTATFFAFKGFGAFVAATFAGLFVGTFGLGFLADRYGRRKVFTYSLLWYSVCSAIMAFQTSAEGLLFWRFITGIGIGVEIITIDTYITELVPQQMRGRAMGFNQAIMFVAAPVAAILSYWLIPNAPFGLDGWRWVVLIGSLGALAVWVIRRPVPESPRWLARVGRNADAERIVQKIESRVAAQYGKALPAPMPITAVKPATAAFSQVWLPPFRSRLIMLVVFNFFQAIGYYGFANWVPTLLIGQGITVTKSLLYSSIIAIALPLGPLIASTFADKIQRKWIIVGSALAVIVFGLLFSKMTNPLPLIVFGVLISLSGQFISVSYHTYQSELFPTSVRCRASGMVYSASRVGAMLSGFLIAYLLHNFGVTGVFAGIIGCMLAIVVSIGVFGPKTTGLSLDEISP